MNTGDPSSLNGRTVVITGASDGIGKAATLQLVNAGAHVVMIGRNEAKTAAAANAIMSSVGRRSISYEIADLSKQREVRDVAARLRNRFSKIDILVNNAGALFRERRETEEGLERTFALNHLAYFSLTLLLLDRLYAAAQPGTPARVIVVASRAHRRADFDVHDLQTERHYRAWRAYNRSKLANLLFTRALAARVDVHRVVVHALHPGVVSSRFATNNGRWGRLLRQAMNVASISPEESADTLVWLCSAAAALESTGDYWVKRTRRAPSVTAQDVDLANAVWNESARLAHLDADSLVQNALNPTPV